MENSLVQIVLGSFQPVVAWFVLGHDFLGMLQRHSFGLQTILKLALLFSSKVTTIFCVFMGVGGGFQTAFVIVWVSGISAEEKVWYAYVHDADHLISIGVCLIQEQK